MKKLSVQIKRFLFCILILSFNYSITAQIKWKKYLAIGSGQFVSGMLDGTIESISYHYENGFKTRFPKANDQFWNPALSWKNKYKGGNSQLGQKFPGSTNIFAFTTDAYHMLRTSKRSIDMVSMVYYAGKEYSDLKNENIVTKTKKRKKWKTVAKDFAILTAIRCAGFHLTYSLMFKQQNNFRYGG